MLYNEISTVKAICSYLIIIITQRANQFNVKMHTLIQVISIVILGRMKLW